MFIRKICFMAHLNDLSGANRALLDLIEEIRNEYDITVIVPRKGELYDYLNNHNIKAKVIHSAMWVYSPRESIIKIVSKPCINFIAEIRCLLYFLFNRYDIVHFNSSTYGCGAKSLKLLGRKYTWHIRELPEEVFNLKYFNKKTSLSLINSSEAIIVISKTLFSKLNCDLDNNKVTIIYDGIKIPMQKTLGKVVVDRLLFVGAINRDKGQLTALKALKLLNDKYGIRLPIEFLGKVINEEYYNELVKYIKENEINDQVSFLGYKPDITQYRTSNRIVVMCSVNEAFGRVTVEALANMQLFVGNNAGATAEIIINGVNGYLYDNDSSDLCEKIFEIMKMPNKEIFLENAYIYVMDNFSIEIHANKVKELLEFAYRGE